ncbi:MAG: hypothetical protein CMF68_01205 [Magnetovibrio sp.]|nr:hypothetical protein [Magnetovibrio sp.]|tara:strand:+ start:3130 stop:3849 length:720 start_codon:yes stop_codon:yes gene_type:complete
MHSELKEFSDIVDPESGAAKTSEEDLRGALQALLFQQCLYSTGSGASRRYFEVIKRHETFVRRFFGTLGFDLEVRPRERMVALKVVETPFGWQQTRFKKDQTLVLLCLRLAYEEGIRAANCDDYGVVSITTDDLVDKIQIAAETEPPKEARLLEILAFLRRKGAVRVHDRDKEEQVTPIDILPGIDLLAPLAYSEHVKLWSETGQFHTDENSRDNNPAQESEASSSASGDLLSGPDEEE